MQLSPKMVVCFQICKGHLIRTGIYAASFGLILKLAHNEQEILQKTQKSHFYFVQKVYLRLEHEFRDLQKKSIIQNYRHRLEARGGTVQVTLNRDAPWYLLIKKIEEIPLLELERLFIRKEQNILKSQLIWRTLMS
jgi:hypothetical protein